MKILAAAVLLIAAVIIVSLMMGDPYCPAGTEGQIVSKQKTKEFLSPKKAKVKEFTLERAGKKCRIAVDLNDYRQYEPGQRYRVPN